VTYEYSAFESTLNSAIVSYRTENLSTICKSGKLQASTQMTKCMVEYTSTETQVQICIGVNRKYENGKSDLDIDMTEKISLVRQHTHLNMTEEIQRLQLLKCIALGFPYLRLQPCNFMICVSTPANTYWRFQYLHLPSLHNVLICAYDCR